MKILHTSDLHLGKNLSEESFCDDQKYILDEITNIVKEKGINVVMIPGDIYDKSIPSSEASMMFDKFLTNLSKMNVKVLITSGNHDSNERLSYGSKIFNEFNIHIVTSYEGQIEKISIDDVDFYLLPFLKPFHLKHLMDEKEYETVNNSNDMMKWILSRENIDKNKKNILLAHQFVMWDGKLPEQCDSESISLNNVGTLDAIDVNLLDNFDYVALGHLHNCQSVSKDTIMYAGSLLKYSFAESSQQKNFVVVDMKEKGNIEIKRIPVRFLRDVREIEGYFNDLINQKPTNDYLKVILHDETVSADYRNRLYMIYPNMLSFGVENSQTKYERSVLLDEVYQNKRIDELFVDFYKLQNNGNQPTKKQMDLLLEVIEEIKGEQQ